MSAPAHFSTKPTAEEERQVRELEERAKRGPKVVKNEDISRLPKIGFRIP